MKNIKTKFKFIFALATLFVAALFGGIFTLPVSAGAATADYNKYPANTRVGYYAQYLGTVERKIPEVKNEGSTTVFPKYGTTLYGPNSNSAERRNLRGENLKLISAGLPGITNCLYDSMDKDGNLYLNGEQTGGALYKHTASADMYYGNVSDTEDRVVKQISYKSRTYGNLITGLYAPAGEVVSLTVDEADLEASGGFKVFIGQVFSDGSANMILKDSYAVNRMPIIANAMNLTKDTLTSEAVDGGKVTFYFGSFLGGPVYLQPVNGGSSFTVTISGGVRYSHFILGYTTEDEFNENKNSSAPYFDLEVWDRGVRHSGPKKYAEKYSYSQLYNAAVFWEKVASLANQFPKSSTFNSSYGINFVYDCFVTAQLVPQNTLNCPEKWLSDALDYSALVSNGNDEILNKYTSRFTSGWGLSKDSASDDAITLLVYSLYTDISSKRNITSENEGLEGLAQNASASLALKQLKGERQNDIAVHATVIHNFGQDLFIQAVKEDSRYTQSTDRWFKSLVEVTKHDMTYYFTKLCKLEVSQETLDWAKSKNYPMFVPSACIYQTGGLYELGGERVQFQTMQPYVIEYDAPFEIDFDKVLELPYGFSYKIKSVSSPENGSMEKLNSHTYIYTPDGGQKLSGKIYIRIGIDRDDKSFTVEDKVLILEFRQKQTKPRILERTTYTYSSGDAYTSADQAFEASYAGYEGKISDNPVQTDVNANADISSGGNTVGTIIEVKGKIFISSSGDFRIALRGKGSGALYLSSDGTVYELSASFDGSENTQFSDTAGTFKDLTLVQGRWLYFKEVLLVTQSDSFLCLGMGKFAGTGVTVDPVTGAYRNNYFADSETAFVGEHRYKDVANSETIEGASGSFTRISPDEILSVGSGWSVKQAQSTFGHIYEGGQNASVEFTFYGTQFAVYSQFAEGLGEFEIYIDGNKSPAKTVKLGSKNEIAGLAYLSSTLTAGSHTVKIKGVSGTFNIDSISLKTRTDPSTLPEIPDLTPDAGSENEDFRKPVDHPANGEGDDPGNTPGGDDPGDDPENKPVGNSSDGEDYTGLIVGLSVGGAGLIAIGVVIFIILRKKRSQ